GRAQWVFPFEPHPLTPLQIWRGVFSWVEAEDHTAARNVYRASPFCYTLARMGNSESSESNPIYQRLIQPIEARRTRLQERWANWTPPGIMLIISAVFLPILTDDALLGALALIILCLAL